MKRRRSVFAGSWYPDSAAGCRREIEQFLESSDIRPILSKPRVGGIVPHAGWFFSGAIACNVIRHLKDETPADLIIIFGMHLHSASPRYIMKEGVCETPLGDIDVAADVAAELAAQFDFLDERHEEFIYDNTIELQLPFIKYFFENARIVPIGVPPVSDSIEIGTSVVQIAKRLGYHPRVIGSTDLTHYGPNYGFMPQGLGSDALQWVREKNDRRMIDAILAMRPEDILREAAAHQNACCSGAVAAAVAAARSLGAESAETVAYATSSDKSPGDSFVGYVGVVF